MKTLLFLVLSLCSLPTFGITLKGNVEEKYNSETDNIYVGLVWYGDDGQGFRPYYSTSVGVLKNGKFKFEVADLPPETSRISLKNSTLSVANIFIFEDTDGDGKFSEKDPIRGGCEDNVLTLVSGDFQQDLEVVGQEKGRPVETLRKLVPGLRLCKVVRKEEHGFDSPFDDLVPTRNRKIFIVLQSAKHRLDMANWT